MSCTKFINCPIHGHIELEPVEITVIDTPSFQRLRELKQLGISNYVYPGATHSRFEHSIGVCHLAGEWVSMLRKSQPELGISLQDLKCVRLAGLCHGLDIQLILDLGHGPFSHLFDSLFIPAACPGIEWCHEDASEMMIQYICDQNSSIDITAAELVFIKDLIHGEPRSHYPQASKGYLFDIVANKRNSIDVDKFDYLLRDCHNVGMKSNLNPKRLILSSRVIDNQICFNQKEAYSLYELFHSRFALFKQVYTHRVSTAIEFMIRDVLLSANPILRISDDIKDMERYTLLNDSILLVIERSGDDNLKESRRILSRLRHRDLYRFTDQSILSSELAENIQPSQISPAEIFKLCNKEDGMVQEDVIVQWLTLNYAMKNKNPIDSVRFFTKHNWNSSILIQKELVSGLIPDHYKEMTVRVFSREEQFAQTIQIGFRRLLDKLNLANEESQLHTTHTEEQNPFYANHLPSSAKSQKQLTFSPNASASPSKRGLFEVNQGLSLPNSPSKRTKTTNK